MIENLLSHFHCLFCLNRRFCLGYVCENNCLICLIESVFCETKIFLLFIRLLYVYLHLQSPVCTLHIAFCKAVKIVRRQFFHFTKRTVTILYFCSQSVRSKHNISIGKYHSNLVFNFNQRKMSNVSNFFPFFFI